MRQGELITFMVNTAVVAAVVAAGYWFLRRQYIHKGYGFTLHWWSLADLAAGFLISTLAMLGIFLVQWLLGAIRVEGFQLSGAALLQELSTDTPAPKGRRVLGSAARPTAEPPRRRCPRPSARC